MSDSFRFHARKKRPAIYCNSGSASFSVQAAKDGKAGNERLIRAIEAARTAFFATYHGEVARQQNLKEYLNK